MSPLIVGVHWWDQKCKDKDIEDQDRESGLGLDERCIIYENLETLRGINVLNYNQKHYESQICFINTQANLLLKQTDGN